MDEFQTINPRLRGAFHLCGGIISLFFLILYLMLSPLYRSNSYIFCYLLIQTIQFFISSAYHLGSWSKKEWELMRKADHIAIILLIFTISSILLLMNYSYNILFSFLSLKTSFLESTMVFYLVIFNCIFTAVVSLKIATIGLFDTALDLYIYLFLAFICVPVLFSLKKMTLIKIVLVLTAGILDLVGACTYAFKKPNPLTNILEHHEIFHIFTLISFLFWTFIISNDFIVFLVTSSLDVDQICS